MVQAATHLVSDDRPRLPCGEWGLPAEDQEQLRRAAIGFREYERGQVIRHPGSGTEDALLIERGFARVYRPTPSGGETTLHLLGPGDLGGSVPGAGQNELGGYVVAVTPTRVARIPSAALERLLLRRPSLCVALARQLSRRLRQLEDRVESVSCLEVQDRITRTLLELASAFGEPTGRGVRIAVPLTQAELATLVGSTRQTVNAVLSMLRAEGLIGHAGRRLEVDEAGLRQRLERGAAVA